MSRQLIRETGSNTHNPDDPSCVQRVDEDYPGEDFGQVCPVCHARNEARQRVHQVIAREIGT